MLLADERDRLECGAGVMEEHGELVKQTKPQAEIENMFIVQKVSNSVAAASTAVHHYDNDDDDAVSIAMRFNIALISIKLSGDEVRCFI